MIRLTCGQIAAWTGARLVKVAADRELTRVVIHSAEVGPGALFVALPGERTHGNRFVQAAWAAGGVALVGDEFPERGGPMLVVPSPLVALGQMMRGYVEQAGLFVVGVTGSVGKTSTKELIGAVLAAQFATGVSRGNYNTAIGLPLSLFAASKDMTHFVAEMGMRGAGEIRQLTEMAPPAIAVITNVGTSHLSLLGSIDAIQRAKGEILEGIRPGGLAVLNRDDPRVRELGERFGGRVVWYGQDRAADIRVVEAAVRDDHTEIVLNAGGKDHVIRLPWIGAHLAWNAAAAFAVGLECGVPPARIVEGLETVAPEGSRLVIGRAGPVLLLEDVYNASPASMVAALRVLATRPGRKLAVLGDMFELGDAEESGHREVGQVAAGVSDWVLGVGERARYIVEEAKANGGRAHWVPTRKAALAWLRETLAPGDVVLLKASRGMEFEKLAGALKEWGGPR